MKLTKHLRQNQDITPWERVHLTYLVIWNQDPADRLAAWSRTVLHFYHFGTPEMYKLATLCARKACPVSRIEYITRIGNRVVNITELTRNLNQ